MFRGIYSQTALDGREVKMFTGIIVEIGQIKGIQHGARSYQMEIGGEEVLIGLKLGDSVAVNGVCLTVVEIKRQTFIVDVMPETLKKTSFKKLHHGSIVNLEPALKMGDSLGGHMVTGHVDGVAEITSVKKDDNAIIMKLKANPSILRYIIKKGSITIDGISLTVVDVNTDSFVVSIIPHTAQNTTIGKKRPGDIVNIETDIIGKYVEKYLTIQDEGKKGISRDFLQKYGYA